MLVTVFVMSACQSATEEPAATEAPTTEETVVEPTDAPAVDR